MPFGPGSAGSPAERLDRSHRIVHGDISLPGPDPVIAASADLTLAIATLRRGTRFLGAGLRPGAAPGTATAIAGPGRAKVIGNGLREVDRFLSLVIDAVAVQVVSGHDHAALCRLDNTARKLALLRARMTLPSPDDAALRAIGRSRDCLFHTGGIVRAGRPGCTPTSGWAMPDARPPAGAAAPPLPLPPGSHLAVTHGDLDRICHFYDRIATELVAALAAVPASIDICP